MKYAGVCVGKRSDDDYSDPPHSPLSFYLPRQDIRNEGDLQDLLSSTDAEGLVVVKFHATLCSSSKQIEAKYEETASEFSDMGAVHFAQVNYDNNAQLCQKMGIESLPHVQVCTSTYIAAET